MTALFQHCRQHFAYAALFSLAINVLQLTVPLYMMQVYDRVLSSRSGETLVALSLAAVGALIVSLLLDVLRARLLLAAGVTMEGLASPQVLTRVLQNAGRRRAAGSGGELRDISTLRAFLTGPGVMALFDVPWAPIYLGVIFLFHAQLGVIASVGAGVLLVLAYLNERLTRAPVRQLTERARLAASAIDGGVRNAELVNVLGLEDDVRRRWQALSGEVTDAQVLVSRRGSLIGALTRCVRLLIQVAMLAAGAALVIDQHVSPGVMITGTLILARALAPAESAIVTWKALIEAREAYRRLRALLAASGENAQCAPRTRLPAPAGGLTCDGVSYAPPGAGAFVVRGVSFSLEPGEALGLVGPSGSGKSTLARLLTGVIPPSSGSVRLDGADLADWPRQELGPYLGYLPQEAQFFAGSVAENIARLSACAADAVVDAARRAHAHELILSLPDGYDTRLGEGGVALSGGQSQRVALARALFGNPRLIVLDEPNASLDTAGDQALLRALQALQQAGVTLIVVSHKSQLLAHMDKILVLNAGRVECFGARAEVLARIAPASVRLAPAVPHLVVGGVK
jgi:PrtD family type I secretion system ABC transporter